MPFGGRRFALVVDHFQTVYVCYCVWPVGFLLLAIGRNLKKITNNVKC